MASSHRRVIRISDPTIGKLEMDAVAARLTNQELTQSGSPAVAEFEAALADFLEVSPGRVVACSSGTAALHLALLVAGIGEGDLVAVPALTYVATVAALRYVGAVPVFVDVDPHTWTMDPVALLAVKDEVTAVLPVDLYGVTALDESPDFMDALSHLTVIRDCCQSFGGPFDARFASVFSFYANKLITTGGEGGAVITRSKADAEHARLLRGQGQSVNRRYWHEEVGYNYRMTAMQAAFGTAQLGQIDQFMARRKTAADIYRQDLAGFKHQREQVGLTSVDWLFSLLVPFGCSRDRVAECMYAAGVETRPVFPSVARMPPYEQWLTELPVTDDIAARGLSLPTHPGLTPIDAHYVASSFINAVNHVTAKGA